MYKTLQISFALKNTYRVNSILYALKQIPLLGKLFPETLYSVKELKIFANILSALWEVVLAFGGKLLYFLIFFGIAQGIPEARGREGFLHILVCLTVIGSFVNVYMFEPDRDKYYAVILMRMNAAEYALVNYGYAMLKVLLGFGVLGTLFGLSSGLSVTQCLLIPFFVAGMKTSVVAWRLRRYEKTGISPGENGKDVKSWIAIIVLLAAAYGLPLAGIVLSEAVSIGFMILGIVIGIMSVNKLLRFSRYREVYRRILVDPERQKEIVMQAITEQSRNVITTGTNIVSKRAGFEYLNELFVKRHQRILWNSAIKVAITCVVMFFTLILTFYVEPSTKATANEVILTFLPSFVIVMYAINRGPGFTRALFVNCDHSLLTYSFYKQPRSILRLFQLRLWELIKINLLPAVVIGLSLAALLWVSGGTLQSMNYLVLIVAIPCMSIFFSVHNLTIYYLLQPYNAGTEIKSATYQIVTSLTYLGSLFVMDIKLSTLQFGVMTIVFCAGYCVVASILIYLLAPRTFKIRM
ncbi:MAG: hypothetical protein E7291_09485 [Lachnospiraceae bacterium]|nr:hypothetical protein [Lachnospiraceae bacterium]